MSCCDVLYCIAADLNSLICFKRTVTPLVLRESIVQHIATKHIPKPHAMMQTLVVSFSRAVLLNLFMAPLKSDQADKFEHIAAILTNVTRLKLGRSLLLEPGRGFIQALVAQLKSANLLRRQGCAAAFRNCCFSAEVCNAYVIHFAEDVQAILIRLVWLAQQDGTLDQILDQRPQLQQVLNQLCGVEASKEVDDTVRASLAESILMLVSEVTW